MSVLGNLSDNDNKISFLGDPVNKDPSASEEKTPSMIAELIESFITSLILLMVIYVFIAFPEVVSGASMEPTLMDGERILVEKVTRHLTHTQEGTL